MLTHRVELFSKKSPLRRRQYHARIVRIRGGKKLWRTSEGYHNQAELEQAMNGMIEAFAGGTYEVVDLDKAFRAGSIAE
jgi:hypothetical protein